MIEEYPRVSGSTNRWHQEGTSSPVGEVTPEFTNQLYYDATNSLWYRAFGSSQDSWSVVNGVPFITTTPSDKAELLGVFTYGDIPGLTEIVFNQTHSMAGFDLEYLQDVVSISFPNLVDVDPENAQGGYFYCSNNNALTSVSLPVLTTIGGYFDCSRNDALTSVSLPVLTMVGNDFFCSNNDALTSVSLPALTTVGGGFDCSGANALTSVSLPVLTTIGGYFYCSSNNALTSVSLPALTTIGNDFYCPSNNALTSVSLPAWLPTNGKNVDVSACALTDTSVNHILARCIASSGYVSGVVNLSGGTNSAPSGQGITDKATLIGRGVTVNTN